MSRMKNSSYSAQIIKGFQFDYINKVKDPYTDEEVLVEDEFKCFFDKENIDEEKFMQIDISDNEYITRINGI